MRIEYRSQPIRRIVLLGESNGFGVCAIDPRNEWFQTLVNLIRDFQDEPVLALNYSIPGCVVSRRSQGYSILPEGSRPSALERYEDEIINNQPDLAIIAFGLNDSRCGTPVQAFIEDLETIVSNTIRRTEALVCIASPYWNTQHNQELWDRFKP